MFKVNSRTYSNYLKFIIKNNLFKDKSDYLKKKLLLIDDLTSWVNLSKDDLQYLSANNGNYKINVPFLFNGSFVTYEDIGSNNKTLSFSTLNFTINAFKGAVSLLNIENNNTSTVLVEGSKLLKEDLTEEKALYFSELVCEWGRGQRVWANLKRLNKNNLGSLLKKWFEEVKTVDSLDFNKIKNVIKIGDDIPGLGVSFASKHLRMLSPTMFPVLDDVLARGLGFALNENGYVLFIQNIIDFKTKNSSEMEGYNISEIEMAFFMLVRQEVRAS